MNQIIDAVVQPEQAGLERGQSGSKQLRYGRRHLDLVRIAKRQRELLYCILGNIVASIAFVALSQGSLTLMIFGNLLYFGMAVVSMVYFARLALAVGTHPVTVAIACAAMLLPLIGLIVLLVVNGRATLFLRFAGSKVGLLGVSNREMHKLYAGACENCGYSTENLAGDRCPECGMPREQACLHCGYNLRGVRGDRCPECGKLFKA